MHAVFSFLHVHVGFVKHKLNRVTSYVICQKHVISLVQALKSFGIYYALEAVGDSSILILVILRYVSHFYYFIRVVNQH